MNLLAKVNIGFMHKTTVKAAREKLVVTAVNILYYYRTHVSSSASPSQFVLPEAMKTFPLFLLCLLKSPAFLMLGDTKLDVKISSCYEILSGSQAHFIKKLYPKLYNVSSILDQESHVGKLTQHGLVVKPKNIPTAREKLLNHCNIQIIHYCVLGAFLIDNGDFIYFQIGSDISIQFLQEVNIKYAFLIKFIKVFGVSEIAEARHGNEDRIRQTETDSSARLLSIVDYLRKEKGGAYQQLKIIIHG